MTKRMRLLRVWNNCAGNTNVAILEMRLIKENHQKVKAIKSLEKHNGNLLCRARWENHLSNASTED